MRPAVFHDNMFPQQSMFLMHLFDLIQLALSFSPSPGCNSRNHMPRTKSFKDAWHIMTHFHALAVNLVNQLMNQINPALSWEIHDVLLRMIRQESEETRFFNVIFTSNGLPSLCYIDRKYTIKNICSENQSNPLLGGLIYKMSKSFRDEKRHHTLVHSMPRWVVLV